MIAKRANFGRVQLQRRRDAIYARHRSLGPWLYVAGAQFFVVQILAALRFSGDYSLTDNAISDLGNTACGDWSSRYVCSPAHVWMNVSFVALGATIMLGSALIYPAFHRSRPTALGFGMFALGGLGTVLVGLFPEDRVAGLHVLGAALPFLVGNLGLVLLGRSLAAPGWLRAYTSLTGGAALVGLVLYVSGATLGLGNGGMERVVAYPQTVWQIVLGTSVLRHSGKLVSMSVGRTT